MLTILMVALTLATAAVVGNLFRHLATFTGSFQQRLAHVLSGGEVGALTLTEAAKLSQNDLQRGIVETFIWESLVLDRLPLIEMEGNAYAYNEEATLPGVEFRAVNSSYTESTGTFNQRTETLVILGGDADVDTYIQKTRGNLNDQRATQEQLKVKAAVAKFQDAFINGDVAVDANSFDGLKKRLTGGQVISTGTNGAPVVGNGTTDVDAFFDNLSAVGDLVDGGPDAYYMNKTIRQKVRNAARRTKSWDQQRDDFGRVIEFYNGVPLLDIGTKGDGTAIIPITETQGTSTDSSSIYAVRFSGDEATPGVGGLTNGGIDVRDLGELETAPKFRTRIEFFCGLAVFGKGAARLTGVRNA